MARVLLSYNSWDSDLLLKAHLSSLPSPSRPTDRLSSLIRLNRLKQDLRVLENDPCTSARLDAPRKTAALKFKIKVLSWALFPINRLPVEILRFTFKLVIRDAPLYTTYDRNRMLITWVCQYWRSVALSASDFWSSIWVMDEPPYAYTLEFLRRAKSAPLDIRISEKERRPFQIEEIEPMSLDELTPIMGVILKKISTIRSFVGVFMHWDVALNVFHRFNEAKSEATSLENFVLHHMGHSYVFSNSPPLPPEIVTPIKLLGGRTPRLTSLSINGLVVDWSPEILANLTSLDIRRIPKSVPQDAADIRQVLQGCCQLYRLSLCFLGRNSDQAETSSSMILLKIPTLRELSLDDLTQSYILSFLSQVDAPNVVYLEIRRIMGITHDIQPTFYGLTGRFPKIRMLSFHDIVCQTQTDTDLCMTKFYQSIPDLEIMKISMVADNIIRPFYNDPPVATGDEVPAHGTKDSAMEPAILCPKLRFLRFGWVNVYIITNLLRKRDQLGYRFRKVYALPSPSDYPPSDDLWEIEGMVDHLYRDYWLRIPEEWALYDQISQHLDSSTRSLLYTNTPGFSPRI